LKLDYIYISVGIITVILNLAATLCFIGRGRRMQDTGSSGHDEIITFRLSGAKGGGTGRRGFKTCDETETLQ
jgi:hypothetical protein